mgnify:CR=1 FL=1
MNSYVIGVDFGTDSVRALLVDSISGEEIEDSVSIYDKWSKGMFCEPKKNQFRQHPSDHLIGLENSIKELISKSKINPDQVKALSKILSKSSPPRKVSPFVESTSNWCSPSTSEISIIEISNVPPPRS